ncbi:uncharacterized protein LOC122076075 [Macadamia integrifolia]|uniref:uncharacterized protein LOC122076075 n=1 Tax=Macadamia integrifolia TaxID=60698 RepID=UPI001C4F09AC|nr:uncharacterized protein LOC122076075 [Macadamia integrifolia]
MTRQIVLRREPLLANENQKMRFAEVAGGTTADCAAVCCCFPCGLVNLLILATYKLPKGLCRKAALKLKNKNKQKKGQSMKNGLLPRTCGFDDTESQVHPVSVDLRPLDNSDEDDTTAKKVLELEKEMWDRFYGAGFWRSPSQRDITG